MSPSVPSNSGTAAGVVALNQSSGQRSSTARTVDQEAAAWLAQLRQRFPELEAAVVVLGEPGVGPYQPACQWPEQQPLGTGMTETAELALAQRSGSVRRLMVPGLGQRNFLAQPLQYQGKLAGVVCMQTNSANKAAVSAALSGLQWAVRGLELVFYQQQPERDTVKAAQLGRSATLARAVLAQKDFETACTAFCTELALTFHCSRVSIGFLRSDRARLSACSGNASFSSEANLTRAIEAAMDEAIDENQRVRFPGNEQETSLTRAHAELADSYGMAGVASVPFVDTGDVHGAKQESGIVTFEREQGFFSDTELQDMSEVVSFCGPILRLQRQSDRSVWRRIRDSIRGTLAKLLGPGHWFGKAATSTGLLLLAFLALFETTYRVAADATLEGAVERVVTAPFASYVAEVLVDPGDRVDIGQLLIALDVNELRLELDKWTSQREQLNQQYQEATATYSLVETQVFKAQLGQAIAQIDLLQDQLDRSRVTASMQGMIISGDWRRSIGEPIERGQVLYKISPLAGYRVALQVDERDIETVTVGDTGELALSAMPDNKLSLRVVRITPVSVSGEGRNSFRVEAELLQQTADFALRPGMTGSGKIAVDERSLLWIWTHRFFEWMRLQLWSWFT